MSAPWGGKLRRHYDRQTAVFDEMQKRHEKWRANVVKQFLDTLTPAQRKFYTATDKRRAHMRGRRIG